MVTSRTLGRADLLRPFLGSLGGVLASRDRFSEPFTSEICICRAGESLGACLCSLMPEDRLGGSGGGRLGELSGEGVKDPTVPIEESSDILRVGRLTGVNLGSWRLSKWESLGRRAIEESFPVGRLAEGACDLLLEGTNGRCHA